MANRRAPSRALPALTVLLAAAFLTTTCMLAAAEYEPGREPVRGPATLHGPAEESAAVAPPPLRATAPLRGHNVQYRHLIPAPRALSHA